jgi:hypothetical protein
MHRAERWTDHSPMTNPGGHAAVIANLSSDVGILNGVIQGVLVHSDWLAAYGLNDARYRAVSRDTLPVGERLNDIFERDARRLHIPRPPAKRAIGTCRDFALMLCSFLRSKGIPARVRCGFAAYFSSPWEDHWVCEYWDEHVKTWRLSDPQIDGLLKDQCRIEFDPIDVPRRAFMTPGRAWLDCRSGRSDPNHFRHGDVTGSWFIKVNVLRDHYALNAHETSVWDAWRAASLSKRVISEHEVALLDDLAARPEQQLVEVLPDWLG